MTQRYAALAASVVIDSTNNVLIFTESGGVDRTATIAVGTYYLTDEANADSLLAALMAALNAATVVGHTFSTYFSVEPNASANAATLGQWAYLYIFANVPDSTIGANVVFRWASSSTTFDPKLIGGDTDGVDYAFEDEGTYTRFISSHCPIGLFVPDAPLASDDDASAVAEVVSSKSPSNARSHFVVSEIEEQKVLSWTFIEHDRVHRKDSGLAFTGEEWGCLATLWAANVYAGGRMRLYAWTSESGGSSTLAAADAEGVFVFANVPMRLPAERSSQAIRLYDVGPLVLAPYIG